MSKIIAVDIDLTAVDTFTPWIQWFKDSTGITIDNVNGVYDLVPLMKEAIVNLGDDTLKDFDPFQYWRSPDLYDSLEPLEGCVECLQELYNLGCSIIFVSVCDPGHYNSKLKFTEKYFPFAIGLISTPHKEYVKYDVFIDDKEDHIELGKLHNPESLHILLSQIKRQVSFSGNHMITYHWHKVKEYVLNHVDFNVV